MPTSLQVEERLKGLEAATAKSRNDLDERFGDCASISEAMDRFGMELAETEFFGSLVGYALRHADDLPGILAHQEVRFKGRLAARLPLRDAPGASSGAVVGAL
jgi:hypothetical protein